MALVSSFRILWANATAQNRVWSNIGWLFADRLVRQGLGLLVLIWMARYLGPTQFGVFNYATAYVALVWSFTDLGLPSIVVRNLVKNPDEAPSDARVPQCGTKRIVVHPRCRSSSSR